MKIITFLFLALTLASHHLKAIYRQHNLDFSPEILYHILCFCDGETIKNLKRVCQELEEITKSLYGPYEYDLKQSDIIVAGSHFLLTKKPHIFKENKGMLLYKIETFKHVGEFTKYRPDDTVIGISKGGHDYFILIGKKLVKIMHLNNLNKDVVERKLPFNFDRIEQVNSVVYLSSRSGYIMRIDPKHKDISCQTILKDVEIDNIFEIGNFLYTTAGYTDENSHWKKGVIIILKLIQKGNMIPFSKEHFIIEDFSQNEQVFPPFKGKKINNQFLLLVKDRIYFFQEGKKVSLQLVPYNVHGNMCQDFFLNSFAMFLVYPDRIYKSDIDAPSKKNIIDRKKYKRINHIDLFCGSIFIDYREKLSFFQEKNICSFLSPLNIKPILKPVMIDELLYIAYKKDLKYGIVAINAANKCIVGNKIMPDKIKAFYFLRGGILIHILNNKKKRNSLIFAKNFKFL